jgi:hypothetical protein
MGPDWQVTRHICVPCKELSISSAARLLHNSVGLSSFAVALKATLELNRRGLPALSQFQAPKA